MPPMPGGARKAGDELEAAPARQRRLSLEARMSKASVSRLSPARMAVASSNALWTVGWPRLQIVIVHRRQIVMDQRIAVHAFERRRDPQRIGRVGVEQRGAFHDQQGPQPLAAVEDAVPHRGQQAGRPSDLAGAGADGQQPVEHGFDLGRARGKRHFELGGIGG